MSENYSSFENELETNGKLIYTNVGVSMLPLLRENRDVMVIEKATCPPKKFQAVLFRRDGIEGRGKYVVHRILKVRKDGKYFIAGDHDYSGEIVDKNNILGVLTAVFRDGKNLNFNSFRYSFYIRFWVAPYRLRFFILRTLRGIKYFFSAVRHKIFRKR